jgi:hypothetical protein
VAVIVAEKFGNLSLTGIKKLGQILLSAPLQLWTSIAQVFPVSFSAKTMILELIVLKSHNSFGGIVVDACVESLKFFFWIWMRSWGGEEYMDHCLWLFERGNL